MRMLSWLQVHEWIAQLQTSVDTKVDYALIKGIWFRKSG